MTGYLQWDGVLYFYNLIFRKMFSISSIMSENDSSDNSGCEWIIRENSSIAT